jgi:beta-glucosidase
MNQPRFPFQNPDLSTAERAEDVLQRLTLGEKIAQMVYTAPAVERLGIPEYNWWNECLHGVARAGLATVFPQAIGLAATFDPALMLRVATAISDEARAKHHANLRRGDHDYYHGLTFWTPNINLFRDPRWGRGQETYGECPFLTAAMGVAFVRGLQGDDPHYLKAVATPKHFAAHSGPEGDRHSFDARVSPRDLRQSYLPAFEACVVEGGAFSVMGAYNRLNGEPCCASPTLLGQILRGEWGFKGYVVSDCGAIQDIHRNHRVTASQEESAALAVRNGCDLNCGDAYPALHGAYTKGLVTEADIDACVRRLIEARLRLGMFDPPESVPYASIPYEVVDCDAHRALALEAARASIVLLKNEGGLLPLSPDCGTIAVIGPNADNRDALLGNYHGTPSRMVTPLEGIRERLGTSGKLLYAPGCDLFGSEGVAAGKATREFAEALAVAERADVVILCMGLSPRLEGEEGDAMNADASGDRMHIGLSGAQGQLLTDIQALGKPVVLVICSGSAVSVPWAQAHVPAIVQQFYPGQAGGTALAAMLFGDDSPSGRLPVTVYKALGQLPAFDDYSMEGRTYRFFEGKPLYSFGFGLSYTTFAYSGLTLDHDSLPSGEPLHIEATVTNTGPRAGAEVVQVYVRREQATVPVPVRELAGMRRVFLKPGESETVRFTLDAVRFVVFDEDGSSRVEPGSVTVSVGGSQPDETSLALGAAVPVTARLNIV